MKVGSRAQVWHGTVERTSGGLTKKDLIMKNGRIKSRRAVRSAKRSGNLRKAGWTFKKGEFGAVRIGEEAKKRTGSKKRKSPSRKKSQERRKKKLIGGGRYTLPVFRTLTGSNWTAEDVFPDSLEIIDIFRKSHFSSLEEFLSSDGVARLAEKKTSESFAKSRPEDNLDASDAVGREGVLEQVKKIIGKTLTARAAEEGIKKILFDNEGHRNWNITLFGKNSATPKTITGDDLIMGYDNIHVLVKEEDAVDAEIAAILAREDGEEDAEIARVAGRAQAREEIAAILAREDGEEAAALQDDHHEGP